MDEETGRLSVGAVENFLTSSATVREIVTATLAANSERRFCPDIAVRQVAPLQSVVCVEVMSDEAPDDPVPEEWLTPRAGDGSERI